MITVISGTNRANSESRRITERYATMLQASLADTEVKTLYLDELPVGYDTPTMYDQRDDGFAAIMEEYVVPASRLVFVVPEYNGSVPGALKMFIDACDIKRCFKDKFAALVGVSSGRAGNIIGLEHLTSILNHMRVNVLHDKVKISSLRDLMDDDKNLADEPTLKRLEAQIEALSTCVR